MPMRRLLLPGALTALALLLAAAGAARAAPQIWFAGMDDAERPSRNGAGRPPVRDFAALWEQDGAWRDAAAAVNVVSINPYYVMRGNEATLRQLFDWAHRRGKGVSVALQALPTGGACGRGVEGNNRDVAGAVAPLQRLQRLGLTPDRVAFDEPLTFGHDFDRAEACHFPIAEVASRLATTVREVRSIFPNVKFTDSEAPPKSGGGDWNAELREWLADYRQATGEPLDAIVLDMNLRQPMWRAYIESCLAIAHAAGTRCGMFLIAPGGRDVTDASWAAEARQYAADVASLRPQPDIVSFARWMAVGPQTRNLPESDPLALTALVKAFADYSRGGRG